MTPDDLLAFEDFVERWLRHVQVALLDDIREIAEEESEQESPDVASVNIGIGHRHDLVVAKLVDVEVVTDPGTHRGDEVADLLAGKDLVQAGFLDAADLTAQWKVGTRSPSAPA